VGKVWRAHRCTTKFYFVIDNNQDSCPVRRKQIDVFFKTSHSYHGAIGFNPSNNFKSSFATYTCPGQTLILVSKQKNVIRPFSGRAQPFTPRTFVEAT
jgi:hypothetical protein